MDNAKITLLKTQAIKSQIRELLGGLDFALGPEEVAELLNISRGAAYMLFNRKDFNCAFKIGKRWVCPAHLLLDWIERQALSKNKAA
jgi:predicted DNA-binding transcriptional regulator AlpA